MVVGFVTRFVTGRWFMVVACFGIMASLGAGYLYAIYSPELKASLGYDQTNLNLISFTKDLGINIGIPAGLLLEIAPPWFVLLVGCVLNFFGYFMIWLAVARRISKPPVWVIALYMWIGANAGSFSHTTAIVSCVKNFPKSRGVVLGLLKGFIGLGSGIYTQLYLAFYGTNNRDFILLIAWLPVVISLVFLRTIRCINHTGHEPEHEPEAKVFYDFLYVSLGLAGFLLVVTILQQELTFNRVEYILSAIGVLLVFFSLFIVAFREERKCWKNESDSSRDHNPISTPPSQSEGRLRRLPTTTSESTGNNSCFQNVFRPPKRGEDYTILQALFSIDMIILLVTSICGLGGALAAIDNLGQMGESLGYPKKSVHTCVSLISIWNYLGRVGAGFVSEHLLKKYKVPRPLMLTVALLLACVGHLLIAYGVNNGLYVASGVLGFCYGAQYPIIYSIISELFGLKHFSTLFNVSTIASPIGGYFFNVKLTGNLYDQEARRQLRVSGRVRKAGEELVCNGPKCFRLAFIIIACVAAFGVLCSIVLVLRTIEFYRSDIYKKFRDNNADDDGE